jgi:hypothetical protein
VDADTYSVIVSDDMKTTVYGQLHGKRLNLPYDPAHKPNFQVIREHRAAAKL